MAESIKTLKVRLEADTSGLKAGFKEGQKSAQTFSNEVKKLLTGAIVIGAVTKIAGAIKDFGAASIQAASDAEETRNKFNVVFKDISIEALKAADNIAQSYGLSSKASQQFLSDTGDLLTGLGFTQEMALDLSTQVAALGSDLASFTNYSGGAAGAVEALTKGLLGEREMMKGLGIAIGEADIARLAQDKGITGELDRQTKAMLTLELAVQQSKNAVGDFARSQDSFANQSRIAQSVIDDFSASFGTLLLPSITGVLNVFNEIGRPIADSVQSLVTYNRAMQTMSTITSNASPEILKLSDEYFNLKNKTELTAKEQERATEIANLLKAAMPGLTDETLRSKDAFIEEAKAVNQSNKEKASRAIADYTALLNRQNKLVEDAVNLRKSFIDNEIKIAKTDSLLSNERRSRLDALQVSLKNATTAEELASIAQQAGIRGYEDNITVLKPLVDLQVEYADGLTTAKGELENANAGLKRIADATKSLTEAELAAIRAQEQATRNRIANNEARAKTIAQLQEEKNTLGLTERQLLSYTLRKQGATDAEIENALAIYDSIEAYKKLADEAERVNELIEKGDIRRATVRAGQLKKMAKDEENFANIVVESNNTIEESTDDSISNISDYYDSFFSSVGGQFESLYGKIRSLISETMNQQLDAVDAETQAILEAAGLQDLTKTQQLEKDLADDEKKLDSIIELANKEKDAEKLKILSKEAEDIRAGIKEKQRELEKQKIIEAGEKKKAKLAYEQAKFQHGLKIVDAITDGISAAMMGFATLGPLGFAFAAIMAGITAANIGIIASNPPQAPAFASGTSFAPGGVALVGERGPELMNVPRGSSIMTAEKTRGMSAGGATVNIYSPVAVDPSQASKIMKQSMRQLAFEGRL